MKRLLCLLLCAAVLLALPQPRAGAAPAPNPVLRVGLAYGSAAMVSANLDNHTGSGYEFGYLGADMQFIPVGSTAERQITMVINRNVYLSGGIYSDNQSETAVGAFHTPHGSYQSREEAWDVMASLREQGTAAFVSFSNGSWLVRSGSFTDSGGGVRETGSNRCISVVRTGTTDILFQFDYGEHYTLCVRPAAPEGAAAQTWHRGRRYHGMFEFRRHDGNNLSVFSVVDMQEYVKGIVPYEMSPSWPLEALKAQAVSARCYAASNLGRHRNDGFNLCNEIHCHVYRGTEQASANSDLAVDETYGQYLVYDGQPCNTVYHASSGGATEDAENVWTQATPYLRGVLDPYEDASKIPGYQWSYTVTNAHISAYLNQTGRPNSGISNFHISQYTRIGNVYAVTVTTVNGQTHTYTKESARTFLRGLVNAPSNMSLSLRYTVTTGDAMLSAISSGGTVMTHNDINNLYAIDGSGNTIMLPPGGSIVLAAPGGLYGPPVRPNPNSGVYNVIGRGNGHNVGMSQWGARCMADLGFTYEQILNHYFTGVEIAYTG